jgi:hypothetical protein
VKKYRGLLLAAAALCFTACEKPPQADIDSAAKAYQTSATNPDVVTYAPDSLRDAQAALAALRAEVEAQEKKGGVSRRYKAVIVLAADAQKAAETAVSDAFKAKEQAKLDATALLEGFAASIDQLESKVWAAKRIRGIRLDPDLSTLAQSSRTALEDAEKDLAAGSYAAAKAKALTIQEKLASGEARVSEAVRLARGR